MATIQISRRLIRYEFKPHKQMKKTCYCFCVLFMSFHSIGFSQSKTDSIQPLDSFPKQLSAKELRKERDDSIRNLTPIPGKSIVYVVRKSLYGMAIPLKLDCDSFEVGWIHSKTYMFTIVDPGEHIFKATSENEFTLTVTLEPGKIYYLEQEAKMGFAYAATKIKMLNDEDGKKYLLKCSLSKHNRYPLYPKSKIRKPYPSDDDGQGY
jgi:hypothetical protein